MRMALREFVAFSRARESVKRRMEAAAEMPPMPGKLRCVGDGSSRGLAVRSTFTRLLLSRFARTRASAVSAAYMYTCAGMVSRGTVRVYICALVKPNICCSTF